MSGEGDLDPNECHSQLSVGTLPLTDKDPPKDPENKSPPQEPSVEEPTSGSLERDKKHPPKDHPETHIDPGGHPAKPPSKRSQKDPTVDPFSRFWSGETADVTDKEGRTLEAAYSAWGTLAFDPNKDDIEQFIQKVEELAKKLGYNQDAQVMAVKSVLPRDVYGICMTYKTLKELKAFLIELFSNPKMREAVPETTSAVAEPGVFSIGQHMENNVVGPTAVDVSKVRQDMNNLQVRFNKITSADFRSKSNKPWKPEVTPPRRR